VSCETAKKLSPEDRFVRVPGPGPKQTDWGSKKEATKRQFADLKKQVEKQNYSSPKRNRIRKKGGRRRGEPGQTPQKNGKSGREGS